MEREGGREIDTVIHSINEVVLLLSHRTVLRESRPLSSVYILFPTKFAHSQMYCFVSFKIFDECCALFF